jgi:hypothetical protein
MEVSGQLHAPAALLPVPIGQEAGCSPEPVWTLWTTENPCPTGNRIPDVQPVAIPIPWRKFVKRNFVTISFHRYWVFRTLSIVQVLKDKATEEHGVSETGSVSVLRWGKKTTLWGPLERTSLNDWSSDSSLVLSFNTWTMDRVRKSNVSESYTPSPESYSNYSWIALSHRRDVMIVVTLEKYHKIVDERRNRQLHCIKWNTQAWETDPIALYPQCYKEITDFY